MHRLFLGCNLWSALFLALAAGLGWAGSGHHVRAGIFAAVFACLVQSGIIALFLGASKLTKEHVGRFDMPLTLIDRVNDVYHRLVPMAAVGATAMAAAAILGGLADVGSIPPWVHHLIAVGTAVYLVAIIPVQYRLQARMHGVIRDVERLLPAPERAADVVPHPMYKPDRIILDRTGRARALLYIGLTIPAPYLGWTFIAGRDVAFLLVPTVLLTAACLGGAIAQYRSARRS